MIKPTELRIGNYVFNTENQIVVIEELESERFNKYNEPYEGCIKFNFPNKISGPYYMGSISGIPITEKTLSMLGFENTKKNIWVNKSHYMFLNPFWYIKYKREGFIAFITYNNFLKDCQYVHQLQNLYFCLTGDNLTLNFNIF